MQLSADACVQVASGRQLSTNLAGEVVILDIERGVYFGLSDVGVLIWNVIQEPCSIAAVVDRVIAEYDVSRETAETDVIELVETLVARGLVDVASGA